MADSSNGMNRRRFLKVLGVTGSGTAAMSACSEWFGATTMGRAELGYLNL